MREIVNSLFSPCFLNKLMKMRVPSSKTPSQEDSILAILFKFTAKAVKEGLHDSSSIP